MTSSPKAAITSNVQRFEEDSATNYTRQQQTNLLRRSILTIP
jgi:hypothetical protein